MAFPMMSIYFMFSTTGAAGASSIRDLVEIGDDPTLIP